MTSFTIKGNSVLQTSALKIEQEKITIRLHVNLQQDQRTHNLPTAEEIAVIIPEEGVHHALDNRDVVLWARGG